MPSLKSQIIMDKLPRHIAVIMDGNGRWAKANNQPRVFGHKNGVRSVRAVSEAAAELGLEFVTLYAFSTENWKRPKLEVNALMLLLVETIKSELKTLNKNNIKLKTIGDLSALPAKSQKALINGMESTKNNTGLTLVLALNYSARKEILHATRKIAQQCMDGELKVEELNDDIFQDNLYTSGMPDPELLIRTSGEQRISNYLLWQIAYAELYFTHTLWPDFTKESFYEAIIDFQQRERRFGKTSEQLEEN